MKAHPSFQFSTNVAPCLCVTNWPSRNLLLILFCRVVFFSNLLCRNKNICFMCFEPPKFRLKCKGTINQTVLLTKFISQQTQLLLYIKYIIPFQNHNRLFFKPRSYNFQKAVFFYFFHCKLIQVSLAFG